MWIRQGQWNKNRNIIINLYHELRQLLGLPYIDDGTDAEQQDTTNMPGLESDESAAQRNNRTGQER